MHNTRHCPDAAATRALGREIAARLFPGAVLLLEGPLGAGKTCFAQGIAAGLGVTGPVQSPTFILVSEYPPEASGALHLFHADLYRLERPEELHALDIPERLGLGVWLVEWADRFPDLWPADHLRVRLAPDADDPGLRTVRLHAAGPRHATLLNRSGQP